MGDFKKYINNLQNLFIKQPTDPEEVRKKNIKNYAKKANSVNGKIFRFHPDNFEKYAILICNTLMQHQAVIIDYSKLNNSQSKQRLIDFISGATYCLGGNIDKLSNEMHLVTPSSLIVNDSDQNNNINNNSKFNDDKQLRNKQSDFMSLNDDYIDN